MAGPFIGPRGGKWADAKHTIPWKREALGKPHHMDIHTSATAETFIKATFPGASPAQVAAAAGLDVGEAVTVKMTVENGRLQVGGLFAKGGKDPSKPWKIRMRGGVTAEHHGGNAVTIRDKDGRKLATATLEDGEFLEDVQGDLDAKTVSNIEQRLEHVMATSDHVTRYFSRDGKTVKNETVQLPPEMQGQGLGTRILKGQVASASKLGIERLSTLAFGSAKSDYIGYYVWPLLGYNAPLSADQQAAATAAGHPAADTHELFQTAEGRSWWKTNGGSVHAAFDLSEGSTSRAVLDAYSPAAKAEHAPEIDEALLGRIWDRLAGRKIQKSGGPFIGPRGGKWADAKHTIPWKAEAAAEIRIADHPPTEPDGIHSVVLTAGKATLDLEVRPGVLAVSYATVPPEERGRGQMVRLYERGIAEAKKRGLRFQSDGLGVSSSAVRVWDSLRRRGYDVRTNPEATESSAGAWSAKRMDDPVFTIGKSLQKSGGPFIGPRGGKWADAKHTIPWTKPVEAHFHSAPSSAMESIKEKGLRPRSGAGLFSHGFYGTHSQGKVFLSDHAAAARDWHGKVGDMLESQHDDPKKHKATMLRVRRQPGAKVDEVGDKDVRGSRYVSHTIEPDDLEYHDKKHGWRPIEHWEPGADSKPAATKMHHAGTEAERVTAKRAEAADYRKQKAADDQKQAEKQAARADATRAEWAAKTPAEREAHARKLLDSPQPIPGYSNLTRRWRSILGVDATGKLTKSEDRMLPLNPSADARYRGVVNFHGILLGIEHKAGDVNPHSKRKTLAAYGEVPGTLNGDGDPVDFLLGDDWEATTAYVLQQRIPNAQTDPDMGDARGNGGVDQYDEDKVVFAARSEQEARDLFHDYYHGAGRSIGGCIELTLDELRDRLWCPGRQGLPIFKAVPDEGDIHRDWLELDAADDHAQAQAFAMLAGFEKSRRLDAYRDPGDPAPAWVLDSIVAQWGGPRIVKAIGPKPDGAGWAPIPGGRKGGWRRRRTGGRGWEYSYPDQHETHHHPDWEQAPGLSGTADIEPGHFVFVSGRLGLFKWTPDHDAAPDGSTWVTSLENSEHVLVLTKDVRPARGYDPAERRRKEQAERLKRKKSKLRPGRPKSRRTRPPTGGGDIPPPPKRQRGKPPAPPPPIAEAELSETAARVPVYADSEAEPGTVTHRIENGAYAVVAFRAADGTESTGMYIPPQDHAALLGEMRGLIHASASVVAKAHGIATMDAGGPTAAYEELYSNAQLGMVLAARAYKGGIAWAAHAHRYMKTYAAISAREEMGGGIPVPAKLRRLAEGYMAARNRAIVALGKHEPDDAEVAKHWDVRKKQLYGKDLGNYVRPHTREAGKLVTVDQSSEMVPMEPWQIRTPTGEAGGKTYPGRIQIAAELREFTDGQRVSDSEVMEGLQVAKVLPRHAAATMPTGMALHVRQEIDAVLAELNPDHVRALSFRWGLDGEDPLEMHELSVALGTATLDDNIAKRRHESTKALKAATQAFKLKAAARDATARSYADRWSAIGRDEGVRLDTVQGDSFNDLLKLFGNDPMRVRIFTSALGSGSASDVKQALIREAQGEATPAEQQKLRRDHFARRDEQRLQAFRRQTAHDTVDLADVRDVSVGSDGTDDTLYADRIIHGYMQAVAKRGTSAIVATPREAGQGQSRVWSDERLARFLGIRPAPPAVQGDNPSEDVSET